MENLLVRLGWLAGIAGLPNGCLLLLLIFGRKIEPGEDPRGLELSQEALKGEN